MGLDMYLSVKTKKGTNNIGYWRKFNALHNWFVDNCQNGTDDCGEYPVSIDDIDEVLGVLKQVKENHELAPELLPTTSGFFFGSTDYDEYYFDDVDETIELFEKILKEHPDDEFIYQSSW